MFEIFLSSLPAILAGIILMGIPRWSSVRGAIRRILSAVFARRNRGASMKDKWTRRMVELLVCRDPATWDKFFKDYGQAIFKWCAVRADTEDQAWDLYQDVMVEILRSVRQVKAPGKLGPFVQSIAWNVWKQCLRSKERGKGALLRLSVEIRSPAELTSPDEIASAKEQILGKLDLLTRREKEAFVLYYVEGQTTKEAGERMGISNNAVRVHLHKARKKLLGSFGSSEED